MGDEIESSPVSSKEEERRIKLEHRQKLIDAYYQTEEERSKRLVELQCRTCGNKRK